MATVALGRAAALTQLPPLALYVHIPWCLKKCPYCDFNSHEVREAVAAPAAVPAGDRVLPWPGRGAADGTAPRAPEAPSGGRPEDGVTALDPGLQSAYLDALQADLEGALPLIWGRSVQTVFIGGGTPSLLSAGSVDRLLTLLRACLRLAPQAEITMEANPGTFEAGRFRDYAGAGVNRLSIGVQSFDDRFLSALGRVHTGAQAHAAIEVAARSFATFNIDLMYGLPGQTLADFDRDMALARASGAPHVSWYNLTLEPNTLFARQPPVLPDDELIADMFERMTEGFGDEGLKRYEVSAWARPGHQARHNINYWEFGDYLGIGAGAHSKLSFHDRIIRQARYRHPRRFMEAALSGAGAAVEVEQTLGPADLPFEFMLNALRLVEGVPSALFAERTGMNLAHLRRPIETALARGLLDPDPLSLRATPLGMRFLSDLQEIFL